MATSTLNKAARELVAALMHKERFVGKPDTVPPGWLCFRDILPIMGCCETVLKERLRKVRPEMRKFRIIRDGKLIRIPHYHVTKKAR